MILLYIRGISLCWTLFYREASSRHKFPHFEFLTSKKETEEVCHSDYSMYSTLLVRSWQKKNDKMLSDQSSVGLVYMEICYGCEKPFYK